MTKQQHKHKHMCMCIRFVHRLWVLSAFHITRELLIIFLTLFHITKHISMQCSVIILRISNAKNNTYDERPTKKHAQLPDSHSTVRRMDISSRHPAQFQYFPNRVPRLPLSPTLSMQVTPYLLEDTLLWPAAICHIRSLPTRSLRGEMLSSRTCSFSSLPAVRDPLAFALHTQYFSRIQLSGLTMRCTQLPSCHDSSQIRPQLSQKLTGCVQTLSTHSGIMSKHKHSVIQ